MLLKPPARELQCPYSRSQQTKLSLRQGVVTAYGSMSSPSCRTRVVVSQIAQNSTNWPPAKRKKLASFTSTDFPVGAHPNRSVGGAPDASP